MGKESEKEETVSCWNRVPVVGPIRKLYSKGYDGTFLTMLGFQYFNQGTSVLVYRAAQKLFKNHYKVEPGEM